MFSETVVFIVVSIGIILVSWKSFGNRHSHGFYRFFVFELLLILILANLKIWFVKPFEWHQQISWVILAASAFLALHGIYLLMKMGNPTVGLETTTTLVMRGAYKYIRHPLYGSLLLLGWGIFFKETSLLNIVVVWAYTAFLIATAKAEEKENVEKFGEAYMKYMKKTKMFIPFVF